MYRVDAHHHLWRYNSSEYDWLEGELATLRRDFMPEDLLHATQQAGVSGTVAVQARQTVQETAWLLELATATPEILGVVGWLPLRDPAFPALLAAYKEQPLLKGLRHVVQAEAPGFLDDEAFNAGVRALQGTGLVYDILIFERQLREATCFIDRHPNQVFVLDHMAKPRIAAGEMHPWAEHMREIAKRENVSCKISGMVTEANPAQWTPAQLRPYFDTVLEAFGPARVMAGSDWPVLCAGCTYLQWWALLEDFASPYSSDEQSDILGGTAARTYCPQVLTPNLQVPMMGAST